jgi:cysteine desulfurase / selenocysteine lyase
MNETIRSLFLATHHYAYLNSAAVSPIPVTAMKAVISQLVDVGSNGSRGYQSWIDTKDRCRETIAGMMNVRPDEIAFVRNTSDGIACIANGLDWQPGDNIVSFAGEFPSNFYPWRNVRDRLGVELRLCPERDGRIDLDEFTAMIDARTRVVAISSVQYGSGYRADLRRIGEAAQAVDALFVVDVIQGLGVFPYDLPGDLVDAAAGASHKWLCSPEGCGFLFLGTRARERVRPTLVGWISVETPWDFVDREQPFKGSTLAWETGTGPSALFYGLEQSLKLLTESGPANIAEYLGRLTDHLCARLDKSRYEIVSSRHPSEKSQIVCIRHRGGLAPAKIAADLERRKIVVSPRGDRLRIAPHFYNNVEDIERLIAALP